MNTDQDIVRKVETLKSKADSGKQIVDLIIQELEKNENPNWVEILERSSALFQHLNDLGQVRNTTSFIMLLQEV